MSGDVSRTAASAVALAIERGVTVATAESLTAGLVAATLADTPGASAMLQGGVVAYQNSVKSDILGVSVELLSTAGSVDADVAGEMADGARLACGADIGISTTGVAGPLPHDGKPVGTVFIGVATPDGSTAHAYSFKGDRQAIRAQATAAAVDRLLECLVQADLPRVK
ncbi:CinA family protein [bacterium RCC_150]